MQRLNNDKKAFFSTLLSFSIIPFFETIKNIYLFNIIIIILIMIKKNNDLFLITKVNSSFHKKIYDFVILCIIPIFLLLIYRSFTWILPQYINPLQIKIGWWQIVPLIPLDRFFGIDGATVPFMKVMYSTHELYIYGFSILFYILLNKKQYKWYLISCFFIFTAHLLIYLLFPCYAYVIDPNFINGETDIINYQWSGWNWSAFPSYHNTGVLTCLFPFIFLLIFDKNNQKTIFQLLFTILFIFVIICILFVRTLLVTYGLDYKITFFDNISELLSFMFAVFIILLAILYFALEDKVWNFKSKNFYTWIAVIGLVFTFIGWVIIWVESWLLRYHYVVDGLMSLLLNISIPAIVYIYLKDKNNKWIWYDNLCNFMNIKYLKWIFYLCFILLYVFAMYIIAKLIDTTLNDFLSNLTK